MAIASSLPPNWRNRLRPLKRRMEELRYRFMSRPQLPTRAQLPSLLNSRGLIGTGAEIGVYAGTFPDFLLSNWRGRCLLSIDPWLVWGKDYDDVCNDDAKAMEKRYTETCARLARFGERSKVLRYTSAQATEKIADGSLDFVYIDAQHQDEAVAEDLALWYPKLRKGGMFAGHDYMDGRYPSGMYGVKSAVNRFAATHKLELNITRETDFPSWYLFKS